MIRLANPRGEGREAGMRTPFNVMEAFIASLVCLRDGVVVFKCYLSMASFTSIFYHGKGYLFSIMNSSKSSSIFCVYAVIANKFKTKYVVKSS